jgi:hypothetical protein
MAEIHTNLTGAMALLAMAILGACEAPDTHNCPPI